MGERNKKIWSSTSTSISTMVPWLPMDVITTHVLPRLPARSLVQYKCVSKAFCSLISSPEFMSLHLRFHPLPSSNRPLLLLVTAPKAEGSRDDDKVDRHRLYSMAFDEHEQKFRRNRHHLSISETETLTTRARSKGKRLHHYYIHMVGCCNGLVCLYCPWSSNNEPDDQCQGQLMWGEDLIFLNLLTGMFTTSVMPPDIAATMGHGFGFGYDSKNDGYKVVQITNHLRGIQVSVYSMKTDSWTSSVEAATTQDSYQPCGGSSSGALVHNHLLHWLCECPVAVAVAAENEMMASASASASAYRIRIVCFDLETELWAAPVPLPSQLHEHDQLPPITTRSCDSTLGILDGCLSMTLHIAGKHQTHVWIMKQYGVQQSWTKLFSIGPCIPKNAFLFRKATNEFQLYTVPPPTKVLTFCRQTDLALVFNGSQ